ncbi:MAG: hypothetical protein IMZ66_02740 [Planctomycetes bacterium]|nr:hypothetical protein [Planctomycetota bacterium]
MAIDARKHDGSVAVRIDIRARLDGLPTAVEVTITPQGLAIRGSRKRLGLWLDWPALIRRMPVPAEAPARCLGDPAKLLD